jgi:diguanylate cyclase (GGDEF)-like protein
VTNFRNRLETLILDEHQTAVVFYLAGAGAGIALLSGGHLSHRDQIVVLALIGGLLLGTFFRISFRDRLSPLGIQIMFTAGWLLVTVAASIGPGVGANLAVFYIWVAVYAALYFKPVFIVLQIAGAEVAYLVVLVASHVGTREIIVSWTSIFGTAVVLSYVVFVLVSVLRRSSLEDRLTGLPNRRLWDERVDDEIERSRRSGTHLSVVSMDVDNFKVINDQRGHAAGDRLLCDVADSFRVVVRRGGDLIARLGGDEFGLLAPGSDSAQIISLMQRLHDTLPEGVSCSMGAATWDHVEPAAGLFRRADEEMFRSKREKKNS